MAGDWIKMRTNLIDDPRVLAIASACRTKPCAVIGALHIFWSIADGHSTDGFLPHYTAAMLDAKVQLRGFTAAMAIPTVDWVKIMPDGLSIPRFDEHNGESAKQRAVCNKRVAQWREAKRKCNTKPVTPVTHDAQQKALPEKRREEKRREEHTPGGGSQPYQAPVVPPPPPPEETSKPPPLCEAEGMIRAWAGDRLTASDRRAIAEAEMARAEAPVVEIHGKYHPAMVLFHRSITEAIATCDGTFRSAGVFLRLVTQIETRCQRDACWPGEGLERRNGKAHTEPTIAELRKAAHTQRISP